MNIEQLLLLTQSIGEVFFQHLPQLATILLLYTLFIAVFTFFCFLFDHKYGYAKYKFGGW